VSSNNVVFKNGEFQCFWALHNSTHTTVYVVISSLVPLLP